VKNSKSDVNIGPHDLHPEKSVAGQEATVRTGRGTTDWSQIGKAIEWERLEISSRKLEIPR